MRLELEKLEARDHQVGVRIRGEGGEERDGLTGKRFRLAPAPSRGRGPHGNRHCRIHVVCRNGYLFLRGTGRRPTAPSEQKGAHEPRSRRSPHCGKRRRRRAERRAAGTFRLTRVGKRPPPCAEQVQCAMLPSTATRIPFTFVPRCWSNQRGKGDDVSAATMTARRPSRSDRLTVGAASVPESERSSRTPRHLRSRTAEPIVATAPALSRMSAPPGRALLGSRCRAVRDTVGGPPI